MSICDSQVWGREARSRESEAPELAAATGTSQSVVWWRKPIPLTLAIAVSIALVFVAYQRIGTEANVSQVEISKNLRGGFLAIGYSDAQPGVLVASAMDQENVRLDAQLASYPLAGTHTRIEIETPHDLLRKRLRGPLVITISSEGQIAATEVDWSAHTMRTLAEAADCHHESPLIKKHCGAPFKDIAARMVRWPLDAIPPILREFLAGAP